MVRGPLSPIGGIGDSGPTPVAGAKVIASSAGGGPQVTSASTDSAGKYRVFLAPGTYVVTLGPMEGYLFTKDVPATVSVTAGQVKVLDILLDTGIR